MKYRITLNILVVAATCIPGCGQPSDAPADRSTSQPMEAAGVPTVSNPIPIEDTPVLSEEALQALEEKYSCKLPSDYRTFLLETNGLFPSPDCVIFESAGEKTASDVFCFFAVGDERPWVSLEWNHDIYSGRLPSDTIPIARDSCGNLWLISVAGDNQGSVFFWDHGSYNTFDETDLANWPRVAKSFTEFRDKLSTFDASSESNVLPSRYAMVKYAAENMAKEDVGFTTRANPGFVYHCACEEDGHAVMEFVKYEIHAAVVHTDGYTRLQAIKGLIEEGPTRLPE